MENEELLEIELSEEEFNELEAEVDPVDEDDESVDIF